MRRDCTLLTAVAVGMFVVFAHDSAADDTSVTVSPERSASRLDHALMDPARPAIAPRALLPHWHAMKERLKEQHNFTFSLACQRRSNNPSKKRLICLVAPALTHLPMAAS